MVHNMKSLGRDEKGSTVWGVTMICVYFDQPTNGFQIKTW
jgi:hypothetical protein